MPSPNFLFIITDEQSPRSMGCYGSGFVRTPHLDKLASQGTIFDSAYCAFPLCVPGRNALMTGQQCHRIKAYDIGSPLASDLPTWAHMFKREGYRTELHGKMHFLGADQLHGFDVHTSEERHELCGFRWGEECGNGTAYPIFRDIIFLDDLPENPRRYHNHTLDQLALRNSLEFLDGQSSDSDPFCLTVGFNFPHYPMIVDRAIFDSYGDVEIPEPTPGDTRHPRNIHLGDKIWGFDRMTPEEHRRSRQAYCAMGTMVDSWIGEVLAKLDEKGLRENTVIVFTSDHGDMWGEHGMWGKNTFYEDSARIPLIVSAPAFGVPSGRRISTPVSHLDLYPTLREAFGVEGWDVPLDGRSLWPALTRGVELPDEPVFSEYYSCDVKGPERMVRFKHFKLNFYYGQGMELFDLEKDPAETVNRIDDPGYAPIRAELEAMLFEDWNPEAIRKDIVIDQNRRVLIGEALAKQGKQNSY